MIRLRRKRVWIPAAVLAAAGVTLSTLLVAGPGTAAGPSGIPAAVPADADTLVVAPATEDWWGKVSPLMQPASHLAGLNPEESGADLEYIGYSRSMNHEQAGEPIYQSLRLFYIEAADDENAETVAEWLSKEDGFQNRTVETVGDIVLVSNNWSGNYKAPDRSLAEVMDTKMAPGTSSALMFKAPEAEGASVTGDPASDGSRALSTVYSKGLGLEPGTTWIGNSSDGEVWEGKYRTGGAKPELLDMKGLADQLDSYAEMAFEYKDDSSFYQGFFSSPADIQMSVFVASPNSPGSFGGMPQQGFREPELAKDEVSTMNMMPKHTAAAAGETQGEDETLESLGMSAGADKMVVTLGFNEDR